MTPKANGLQCRLCLIVLLAVFFTQTQGQTPASDYFAPLDDLKGAGPQGLSNQNFTRCCLRAVDEWRKNPKNPDITVESSQNPSRIFSGPDDLSNTKPEEQFPCGAEYDSDEHGATRVKISYAWCKSNCGGWQRSRSAVLEQWVQPFVGFVLPAAVFCLNVPRKMVINISDDLFSNVSQKLKERWIEFYKIAKAASTVVIFQAFAGFLGDAIVIGLKMCLGALLAATIGLINVVVWVLVVFSTAAPMILSGLYEATIDRQVIRAIEKDILKFQRRQEKSEKKQNDPDRPNDAGDEEGQVHQKDNQKYDPDKIRQDDDHEASKHGDNDADHEVNKNDPSQVRYQIHLLYAVLVGNLMLQKPKADAQGTEQVTSKNQTPTQTPSPPHQGRTQTYSNENVDRAWDDVKVIMQDLDPLGDKVNYKKEKAKTETRLKTMLECQASFGATIGAPVAFYLGSFLFSVFGNHGKLGDSDVSLSLAFGEWWMTIPHVAIVSGCLLAGNNPNTLEAIVSGIEQVKLPKHKSANRMWTSFYKSVYQPVWMWERGRNKRNWIKKVQHLVGTEYPRGHSKSTDATSNGGRLAKLWRQHFTFTELKEVPKVGGLQWTFLVITASILIIIPFVLTYVTSFYTPTIGLSCRTFTFVLYFVFQSLLTILWLCDFNNEEHHPFRREGSNRPTSFFFLTLLFFVGSSFTAIIGTFMQILGVYRNCLCNIPMGYWGSRDYHFTVSSNSADGIYYAGLYWLSTGIASICLLVIFCYLGWWYQRHWRMRFNKVVEDVLSVRPKVKVTPEKDESLKTQDPPKAEDFTKPKDKSKTKDPLKNDHVKNVLLKWSKKKPKADKTQGSKASHQTPDAEDQGAGAEKKAPVGKDNQQPEKISKLPAAAPSQSEAVTKDGDTIEHITEVTK